MDRAQRVDRSPVDGSWVVDWSWMVHWGRLVDWGSMITPFYWSRLIRSSNAFIGNVGNVPSVMVSGVFYILKPAVRKKDTVVTIDGFSVRVFSCFKVCTGVFIFYSISVLVRTWFIYWFIVFWGRVVRWFWCWVV